MKVGASAGELALRWTSGSGCPHLLSKSGKARRRAIFPCLLCRSGLQFACGGYKQMRKTDVPVYLLVIVSLSVSSAWAQAVAESALINSMSSTSAAKAGTTFGQALNQATHSVQQRTSTVLQGAGGAGVRNTPAHTNPPMSTATSRLQTVPGGLGISVRGGQLKCDPISPAVQTSDPKSAQPVPGNCNSQSVPVRAASSATQEKTLTKSSASSSTPK
jgi:hypothetical protein